MAKISAEDIIESRGFMVTAFPINEISNPTSTEIGSDLYDVIDYFAFAFENAGFMSGGKITTTKVTEREEMPKTLRDIQEREPVAEKLFITSDKMEKCAYLKGAKKIERTAANSHKYTFSEDPVAFPNPWDRPGRTMLTSGSTLDRSTHVVADYVTGRLRLLTPIEAECLQGSKDNWTNTGMPDRMRYFCMRNALVVPMITRMSKVLDTIISAEK